MLDDMSPKPYPIFSMSLAFDILVGWFVGLLVCWFVGLLICWFVDLLMLLLHFTN
jgi:hypothetical protein